MVGRRGGGGQQDPEVAGDDRQGMKYRDSGVPASCMIVR